MPTVHGSLPILAGFRSIGGRLGFVVLLLLGLDTSSLVAAPAAAPAPVYWKQRLFYIPYQVNQPQGASSPIAKVQLLLSQDGNSGWQTLQEAEPNVRGFGYHAPKDGEYWFALRHLDQRGRPWPSEAIQPQMRIVVDTVQPQLQVAGTIGESGTVEIRYESRDSNLRSEKLVVEARGAQGVWSRVQLGPPEVSQPDQLAGRASWVYPHTAKSVEIRASIADKAGHQAQSSTVVTVAGPALQSPRDAVAEDSAGLATTDPFQAHGSLSSRDWPANNRLPSPQSSVAASTTNRLDSPKPSVDTPPLRNPYTVAQNSDAQGQTSAQLLGGSRFGSFSDAVTAPGPMEGPASPGESGWAAPPSSSSADLSDRMVNSLAFDIDYDLQSVGPWGVSKVELWGTHDDGKTWQSYSVDTDNRSPVRVSVPDEGIYGFRILVDGANGTGARPPTSGEKPELIVAVDLQAPQAEIVSTELGQGNLSDHLLLRWTAGDRNLEARPIGLLYSTNSNGPWLTIATGLENTGSYTWRLPRHIPNQFYVRLEARDQAGNLATHQTTSPISLSRPQPTGRLRSVRPIGQ